MYGISGTSSMVVCTLSAYAMYLYDIYNVYYLLCMNVYMVCIHVWYVGMVCIYGFYV